MKKLALLILLSSIALEGAAQINAKLMQHLDVSATQIIFVYGGDIWIMSKAGGMATQLTHSPGEESWPRFSPDGQSIAFTANYQGNPDIYVMPVKGGIPTRLTYHAGADRLVDWHPDGERLLMSSRREMGQRSTSQLFLIDKEGGMPQKLPLPYGEIGSYSPDGKQLAYITKITENYPFKRYRGGLTSDILIYDTESKQVENITQNTANDGKPAWAGDKLYYLSDVAANMRLNVWEYDPQSKERKQITQFDDFDIGHMAAGPEELVFEAGGELYLMDLESQAYATVEVQILSDLSLEMPRSVNVSNSIRNMSAAPGGKRIVFEARGELFNVPVKEGYSLNLTQSSGAFDQSPSWSPDGKHIAYWSDASGEYQIYLQDSESKSPPRQLTKRTHGLGYKLHWSPDSKKIAFIDEKNDISIIDASSGETTVADNTYWNQAHPGRINYPINWSPDSRWITYNKGLENSQTAIFVYDLNEQKAHQITSGFYNDASPVFSTDGKYLFYVSNRNFSPSYSALNDGTWVYPNAGQLVALSLTKETPSLLAAKNDALELKTEKAEKETPEAEPNKKGKKKKEEETREEKPATKMAVSIDFDQIEARLTVLPPAAGNVRQLMSFPGKLVYVRFPNTGSGERTAKLMYYDLEKREEKEIISPFNGGVPTADGKAILVRSRSNFGIIQAAPGQKIEKPIPTDGLVMQLIPKEEWRQIFQDTWRRHRDCFYDPNMQGVDWDEMRTRYGALIEDARTRWDVTYIQSNLVAELSAGHTYSRNGDVERVTPSNNGSLGIDWELADAGYRIKRIVKPAAWDTEIRSPFDRPGVEVAEGDYILSVNGRTLDPEKDPFAAFEGLGGKTISLMLSKTGQVADQKQIILKALTPRQENQLRYLEWIEQQRLMVEKLSDGKLGYVYMSNTAGRGQLELVRMFYGQLDKEGFIIDERFNGGGQLADRFLELLQRPVVYNLHWRHGRDHTQPVKTNTGPMGMLINGWAGSGGDGLPWAFQELEAGPIVGERTLGILVGPATGHRLIDGGSITVPGARLYDNDGHWFWEGEGVAPDIKVWDDPNILMQGRDPQMERVVSEVLKMLETQSNDMTPAPASEDRTAKGQNQD
ncbi:MAG: PDZ domain-containing protein [Bacteroidota bacterium]